MGTEKNALVRRRSRLYAVWIILQVGVAQADHVIIESLPEIGVTAC